MPEPNQNAQEPRRERGNDAHLSAAARALVIERLMAGDTNAKVNKALRSIGELPLSESAFTRHRKSDEVRVSKEQLTNEARQAGHFALSRALVHHINVMDVAATALLNEDADGFAPQDVQDQKSLAQILHKSSEFIWAHLGVKDVMAVIEQNEKQSMDAIAQSGMNEAQQRDMVLMLKKQNLQFLEMIAAQQQQAETAATVATLTTTQEAK